ncbi:MAG: DUF2934 domain-containing protein [Candidatus Solibacter sp.]
MATSVVRDKQTQRNGKHRGARSRVRLQDYEELQSPPVDSRIAELAYSYWQSRGGPLGSPEEDWMRAERDIQEQERQATGAA